MREINAFELLEKAKEAKKNSYSPYSGFAVGAALLCGSGKVYTGCNIENGAFSPTCCAERVAFFKAISEGERDFKAIAIVGGEADGEEKFCPPCGVCRQVMSEFVDSENFKIYLVRNGKIEEYTMSEILPLAFEL
jgi:cytidine deaminase